MSNKKHFLLLSWAVIATACAVFLLIKPAVRSSFNIGNHNRTLFFADGGSPLSALLYTAYEKTYFFTQKVNFHLSVYPSGRDALRALLDGKADLATVADVPIAHAALESKDFFVLASIASSRLGVGILASEGISEPEDLRGKKIGFAAGTNSEFFLHEFLIKHGISTNDVVLVPLLPSEIETELGNRGVQAVSIFDPALSNIKQILGSRAQVFYAPDIYTFTWNVVASRRMLEHPDVLQNIIRALHVAEEFAKESPTEAIEITSRYLRINKNQSASLWDTLDLSVDLLQSLIVNLERQAKWASPQHKNAEVPDFGRFIFTGAMKSVLPNKMTVIE